MPVAQSRKRRQSAEAVLKTCSKLKRRSAGHILSWRVLRTGLPKSRTNSDASVTRDKYHLLFCRRIVAPLQTLQSWVEHALCQGTNQKRFSVLVAPAKRMGVIWRFVVYSGF